jgi:hypothetical protein
VLDRVTLIEGDVSDSDTVRSVVSPEDVYEALAQAGIYGGLSGWHNATLVAAHVFAQPQSSSQQTECNMTSSIHGFGDLARRRALQTALEIVKERTAS